MPECNLPLSSKIEERTIEGKTVYFVNGNYLVACFDEGITEKLIKSVIDVPDSDKPYYFYMRNLGLESDKVLDNFEQLFVHFTVIANEDYAAFVSCLQSEIREALRDRPTLANKDYFFGKSIIRPTGRLPSRRIP